MVVCTFDTTTVNSYQIETFDMRGSAGAYSLAITIRCRTTSLTDYTALAAKRGWIGVKPLYAGTTRVQTIGGTCGSLVLNGTTYTNMYISALSAAEASKSNLGLYEYTISFVRHTAS